MVVRESKLAYTVREAAEQLSLSEATLWILIATGQLRTRKVGRKRLVAARELQRFLETDHVMPKREPKKAEPLRSHSVKP